MWAAFLRSPERWILISRRTDWAVTGSSPDLSSCSALTKSAVRLSGSSSAAPTDPSAESEPDEISALSVESDVVASVESAELLSLSDGLTSS